MELLQLKLALGNKSASEFPHKYLIAAYIKRKSSWYQQDPAISSGKPQEYLILLKALHFTVRGRRWIFLLSGDTGNCLSFVACTDRSEREQTNPGNSFLLNGTPYFQRTQKFYGTYSWGCCAQDKLNPRLLRLGEPTPAASHIPLTIPMGRQEPRWSLRPFQR